MAREIVLPVNIDNSLPENVVMIPYGLKETAGVHYPFFGEIESV